MLLYQKGLLDLDAHVASASLLGELFAEEGKENITIRNLLLHNAGEGEVEREGQRSRQRQNMLKEIKTKDRD